mgnify:CR=1 FL=1
MSAWRESALSEVLADATMGFACGEDVEDGVFQFRMNNITTEGQLDLRKKRRVPRDYLKMERFFVQPGDVLFNATNSPDLVGKTAFFPGLEEPAVFSNHFLRLRPRDGDIDGRYLTRWLNVQFLRGRFKGMCRQWVNQATVARDSLLSLPVPLPPLPEQRRIAAILDKADELRAKRRAALAKLDNLTQSIFLDMFGDPATNPKGWPKMPFGEVCDTRLGKMLDQKQQTGEHRRHYLRNANVKWFHFDLADVFEMDFDEEDRRALRLRPGDLLICEGGEPGRAAVWQGQLEECYFQKALHRARPNEKFAIPEYLCWLLWFLARGKILTGVTSATIAHLTGEKLSVLPTLLPPAELQLKFTEILRSIQSVAQDQLTELRNLDALFSSLQHRAFRGEL